VSIDGARRRLQRALAPTTVALAAALSLAACGQASGAPAAAPAATTTAVVPSASVEPSASPVAPTPQAPLTGLPTDAAVALRPAVAVAISLPAGASPAGISSADVVYEAWLDHAGTRLLTVFQSHDPAKVGPVGGTLPSDAQVLSVLHPVLAETGGSAGFVKTLHASPVVDATPATAASGYSGAAPAWSALPSVLRDKAGTTAVAPPPLFAYDDGVVARNHSVPATAVSVTAPGRPTEQWSYDKAAQLWRRRDSSGISASATNLVLQTVPYDAALLHHPGTATVAVARPLGSGHAVVLSGPAATTATWTKPGMISVTNFLDTANVPVWFRPGTTWVVLLSPGSRVSTP
jgi:hypothetical protein